MQKVIFEFLFLAVSIHIKNKYPLQRLYAPSSYRGEMGQCSIPVNAWMCYIGLEKFLTNCVSKNQSSQVYISIYLLYIYLHFNRSTVIINTVLGILCFPLNLHHICINAYILNNTLKTKQHLIPRILYNCVLLIENLQFCIGNIILITITIQINFI